MKLKSRMSKIIACFSLISYIFVCFPIGLIAEEYKRNVIIVRIDGHLTSCVYGTCVDIWDCTGEKVDCFWIVQ